MHYIQFLMSRGFAPYRQIGDMNLPGAYLFEGWAMHLFGGGDLAWRIYDFSLMGAICVAMIAIALPYDWLAGLFAGVMFALVHTSEGPLYTGERDEVMTALIVIGVAFLFAAVRRKKPWMMVLFGLCLGMASSIKPTVAPMGFVLLLMAWWTLRKRGETAASYMWGGVAGAGIAGAIVFGFLFHYHSAGALYEISRAITPYYASIRPLSFARLLRLSLPRVALLMLPFALAVAVVDRQWRSWERWALLLGVVFGAISYFAQGKGFSHHRYELVAFLLLWMALELTLAMRREGWRKGVGIAGMALGALVMAPTYAHRVLLVHPVNQYTESLEGDLTRLGGERLQRQVQCFDVMDGCINALYHLKLVVQNTSVMGDILYFSPVPSPVVDDARAQLWKQLSSNPPAVVVLSNACFNEPNNFDKIKQWPQFAAWLNANYTMAVSREFEMEEHHAYRIYLRNGATLTGR
jgi:MFS family permease